MKIPIEFDGSDSIRKLEKEYNKITDKKVKINVDVDASKATREVSDLEKQFLGLGNKKVKVNTDTTKANKDIVELKNKLKLLSDENIQIKADTTKAVHEIDELRASLRKLESQSKETNSKIGSHLSQIGKVFAGNLLANATMAITNAGREAVQTFVEFDKQIRNVGTLGVTNLKEVTKQMSDLSTMRPDDAGLLTSGLYDAISAGTVKVKDGIVDMAGGMKFMESASMLATAGMTSTQDAVNGLTSILNAYKLEAEDTAKISDLMFATVKQGKTTIPELNSSLAQVIPNAAAMGVEFREVGAAIATMTKQGVPTAQAATQLKAALVELQKPGKDLAIVMKKAGVSLESIDTNGLQVELKKLGEELEREGKSATQAFSSTEAGAAVTLLSGKNAALAADDYTALGNAVGSTKEAFDVAAQSMEVQMKMMKNSINAAFGNILGTLQPILSDLIKFFTESVLPIIGSLLDSLIPLIKSLIDTIKPIFEGIIKLAQPIITELVNILIPVFNDILKAIQPVIDLLPELGKIFGDLFKALQPLITTLTGELSTVLAQILKDTLPVILNLLKDLTPLIAEISKLISFFLVKAFKDVGEETGKATSKFEIMVAILSGVVKALTWLVGAINTAIKWVDDFVKSLGPVGDVLNAMLHPIDAVGDAISSVFGDGKDEVDTYTRSLKEATTAMANLAKITAAKNAGNIASDFAKKIIADIEAGKTTLKIKAETDTVGGTGASGGTMEVDKKIADEQLKLDLKGLDNKLKIVGIGNEKERAEFIKTRDFERQALDWSIDYWNQQQDIKAEKLKKKLENEKKLYEGFFAFNQSISEQDVEQARKAAEEKLKDTQDTLKKEREMIFKDLADKNSTVEEYQKAIRENDNKEVEAQKTVESEIIDSTDRIAKAFEDMAAANKTNMMNMFSSLGESLADYQEKTKDGLGNIKTDWDDVSTSLTQATVAMTMAMASNLGKMLADGTFTWKEFGKMVLGTVIDSVTAALNAYAVQIVAVNAAALPFGLGIPSALAIIAGLNVALQAVKGLAGADEGVIGIDKRYNKPASNRDTIPIRVRVGESILTPEFTNKHENLLNHLQAGRSEESYFAKNYKSDTVYINMTGELIKVAETNKALNETLIKGIKVQTTNKLLIKSNKDYTVKQIPLSR